MISGQIAPRPQAPVTTNHDSIRLLLRAGRNVDALQALQTVIVANPGDLAARELLFDGYFQSRRWDEALVQANTLLRECPDEARYRMWRISTLANLKRYAETVREAGSFAGRYGENARLLNVLKIAHFYLNEIPQAVKCGQRAMEMTDAEAWSKTIPMRLKQTGDGAGKNIISFSLWGANAIYIYGALINTKLARRYFPDWICRFYIGDDVPEETIDRLQEEGAEIIRAYQVDGIPAQFMRFLPLSDPGVERFMVRDCDSRVGEPEAELVDAWIKSELPFHVMRAHVLHNDLMLAGLWGGTANTGMDFKALLQSYFTFGPTNKYGHDQLMLGRKIWPLIRNHCLVHDRYYSLAGVQTVRISERYSQLGSGYQNHSAVMKEASELGIPALKQLREAPVWQ